MSSAQPLISARQIRVRFGGNEVLKGVDIDLMPGEVHALTGENGAGKSTLARVIAGIYRPSGGTVEVGGKQVEFRSPTDAVAAGVALVHQEPMTFDDLTVAENIFLTSRPRKAGGLVDWKTLYEKADELLKGLGQKIDPRQPVGQLTLAGQQMVEVAAALAQGARVILLDETTAALSPAEVEELFTVVRRLRDEGRSIALVSHRLHEVFALCDRVTVLRDGEKVGELSTKESSIPAVVKLMVGRDVELSRPPATTLPGESVLEVSGLSAAHVKDVSFQVRRGEIVALAGLVGSGRTEIAHALFGIEPMKAGTVKLDGQALQPKNPRHAIQLGLALVPEDRHRHGVANPMSLSQNVSLPVLGRLSKPFVKEKREREMTERWIERLAVVCRSPSQPMSQLSGGNQQKLVLGKWLETKPKLFIVDEPTRGVDIGAKAEVHKLLRDLANQGMAVLVISSDLPEVLTLADRILVMREGRLAAELPGESATEEAVMMAATGQGVAIA